MPQPAKTASLASLLALLAFPAWAHVGAGGSGCFSAGFLHPLTGLDHIVAMVSVGLWGAQLGMPAIWILPVAFPTVMAIGGFMGLIGIPIPGVEIGIALSALILGLMVLTNAKPPLWIAFLLVAAFAICHGHAHGTELPPGKDGLTFSLGFVTATGLLHAAGIALGLVWASAAGRVAVRGLGAAVASTGCYFLWTALAA